MHEKYTDNMAIKKLKKRKDKKKLYQPGGMYADNSIPQGLSTTNLVQEESDPNILVAKEEKLDQTKTALNTTAANAAQKIEQDELVAQQEIEAAGANATAGIEAGVSGVQQIAGAFVKPENAKKSINPFQAAGNAYRSVKAAKGTVKAAQGFNKAKTAFDMSQRLKGAKDFATIGKTSLDYGKKGINLVNNTQKGLEGAKLATTIGKDGLAIVDSGTQALAKGSAIGAGLKSFATSGAGIGTIASLAGAGVSKLSDDGDATTMKFGEGAGATLSGIGTGIGAAATTAMLAGSTLGPVGTLVGAGLGAVYGLGKGLIQRKKARKEEKQFEAEKLDYQTKTNANTSNKFGASLANVRSSQLKSKTFSGYDLGKNTSMENGGMYAKKYGDGGTELRLSGSKSYNCGPGVTQCGDTEAPLSLQSGFGFNYNTGNKGIGTSLSTGLQASLGRGDTRSGAPIIAGGIEGKGSLTGFSGGDAKFNKELNLYGKVGFKKKNLQGAHDWSPGRAGFEAGAYGNYDALNKNMRDVGVYGGYGNLEGNVGYNMQNKSITAGVGLRFRQGGLRMGMPRYK